ncbi:MAG: fluoride efflux transporter CrcB [Pirellulales bacterium]
MWQKIAWLALAGALGTLTRYGLGGFAHRFHQGSFPVGTLTVNAVGCLLFGFVWIAAEERAFISTETRVIVLTGFMGALTTFSTYVFDSGQMLRNSEWLLAGGYFFIQNALGLFCLYLGTVLARWV